MLSKCFRLKWRDINFLIKKRKYFPTRYFGFFYYDQYPNLKFNQISINIPLKYNKKAVHRTVIKRQILTFIQDKDLINKKINGKFYKIFITLNKKNIWELKSQIEKFDKTAINHYILTEFENSFFRFFKIVWA